MTISALLRGKPKVVTIEPSASIAELVGLLAQFKIGCVVVSASGGQVDGIVSERDVVAALGSTTADLLAKPVSAIMTRDVLTVGSEATFDDLMRLMTDNRIRHIPIVDGGSLIGIVSIGDVVKQRIDALEAERGALVDYISGR